MAPKLSLDTLTVPSTCPADWASMVGNEEVRFCQHCNLHVHNLSEMTRGQAQRLVARSRGRLCVRYLNRPDGQIHTQPISRRISAVSRRLSRLAAGAFTASLSVTSAVAQSSTNCQSGNCDNSPIAQISPRWALGARVIGVVTDQNGAVIAGASIMLVNTQTNAALYTSTDFSGLFRFEGLDAGVYNLRVESSGFAPAEIGGFYLPANRDVRLNETLSIAPLNEEVQIEGSAEGFAGTVSGMVAFTRPESLFVRAAQEDDMETLLALLAGTDINQRDKLSGTTALEHAVINANREMVQLLLSAGANVNLSNPNGRTVLMMMDSDATSDLAWDLINFGAKVNAEAETGVTALMELAQSNNIEVVKTLLDAGATADARSKQNQTALMLAAAEGLVNMVRLLLLAGADLNAVDKEGKNALQYARDNEHTAVVRLFKSKGAIEMATDSQLTAKSAQD